VAARKPYRRNAKQKEPQGSQAIVIFWLIFAVVIIFVYMINAQTIKKNFDLLKSRLTNSTSTEGDLQEEDELSDETTTNEQPAVSDRIVVITNNDTRTPTTEQERQSGQGGAQTQTPGGSQTQTQTQGGSQTQSGTQTQGNTQSSTQTQQTQTQTQTTTPAQVRERSVYFAQINKDGQILQTKVTRRVPVSETPMMDVLNIILAGPSTEEINRGVLNLIPKNTRLLNATVRGSTAYISFSEDFLFNTFGVEGYVAQLRQVVWTVTEFSNVADVQILIEGRRVDYLGEGIFIGSPISRQSF